MAATSITRSLKHSLRRYWISSRKWDAARGSQVQMLICFASSSQQIFGLPDGQLEFSTGLLCCFNGIRLPPFLTTVTPTIWSFLTCISKPSGFCSSVRRLNTTPSSVAIVSPLRACVDNVNRVVSVKATEANSLVLMYFKVPCPPASYKVVAVSRFTNARKDSKTYHFILGAILPTPTGDQEDYG